MPVSRLETHPKYCVAVCGPTGSGKSGLAIHLAQLFSGEVINCDSLQVYRHFDIGTAKLPAEQRDGVRHHLIDVAEPEEGFTAGDFARTGRIALREIAERGNLPILAGGTGFYLRALLDGLPAAPPADATLRVRLVARESRRPGALHRILRRLDPLSAGRIHPHDIPKLIRALEIRLIVRSPASSQPAGEAISNFRVLKLGLFPPRAELYQALDRRAEEMLAGGLAAEVAALLARGVSREAKPFQSLGYKEALAVLDGRLTLEAALAQMQRDTRRYAKRQVTWFRNEPGMVALTGFGDDPSIRAQARDRVEAWLTPDLLPE